MIDDLPPELQPLMAPLGIMHYWASQTDYRLRFLLFVSTIPEGNIERINAHHDGLDPTVQEPLNPEEIKQYEDTQKLIFSHLTVCENKAQNQSANALVDWVTQYGCIGDVGQSERLEKWITQHRELKQKRNRLTHDAIDFGIYEENGPNGTVLKLKPLRVGMVIKNYKAWERNRRKGPQPVENEHYESLNKEEIEDVAACYRDLIPEVKDLIVEISHFRRINCGPFII
ncbi:MAG: hypothetical protein ABJN98_09260 [Roseibium sp.]